MPSPHRLTSATGETLAYHATPGRSPGVVFLTGFRSDMQGVKALALEQHLRARGNGFIRFDYSGHGESSGRFDEGTIGTWTQDALSVIDDLTAGPQVLVGSSMGGWIMLLAAQQRPARITGLLGIAPAADFTEDLIHRRLSPGQQATIQQQGYIDLPSCYGSDPYRITRQFLEEGRANLLLHKPIRIAAPVRLIHGMQDEDVPWQTSLTIAQQLDTDDVEVQLVKNGDHRLSDTASLDRLCRTLDQLLDRLESA